MTSTEEFTPPVHTIEKNKSEKVYFVLDEYRGNNLASFRVWFTKNDGATFSPSSKGISVRIEQLPELIAGMNIMLAEAVKRGLLPEEALDIPTPDPEQARDLAAPLEQTEVT